MQYHKVTTAVILAPTSGVGDNETLPETRSLTVLPNIHSGFELSFLLEKRTKFIIHFVIHSFILQMFTEHLLFSKHYSSV